MDNNAIRDLFALLEQDLQGQWCFKSLSRDGAKFQSAISRLATPTAAPQSKTIEAFRDLKPGWDSYGGREINTEAIKIALRLAPLLPVRRLVSYAVEVLRLPTGACANILRSPLRLLLETF